MIDFNIINVVDIYLNIYQRSMTLCRTDGNLAKNLLNIWTTLKVWLVPSVTD